MSRLELTELDEVTADEATLLTTGYRYGDFRRLRRVEAAGEEAYLAGALMTAAAKPRTVRLAALEPDGTLAGLLLLQALPYDTDLFGLPMAGIPFALVRPDHPEPRAVWKALVDALPRVVLREGYVHVSARVDTADLAGYHALADARFQLMETLVSMTYDTSRRGTGQIDPTEFDFDGRVRLAEERDVEQLADLSARSFTLNRYHADEHLPDKNAGVMMAQWIRNYCADPDDHEVWVAEHADGRIGGFLGHALNRSLEEHTGVLVSGRALLAVEEQRSGVGLMLSRHHTWQSRGDYKEADTQLNNYGMIKVSFNLDMDMVRTKYSFHRWFGE